MEARNALSEAKAAAQSYAPGILPHLTIASDSANAPVLLPRTMADLSTRLGTGPYDQSALIARTLRSNQHRGQRKLSVALIEFLSVAHGRQFAETKKTAPLLVVYAGASILAALAAHELFPCDRFICYDPCREMTVTVAVKELGGRAHILRDKVHVSTTQMHPDSVIRALRSRPILLFTDAAGTFDMKACSLSTITQKTINYEMAFVSDIRRHIAAGPAKELAIAEDMANQAIWTLALAVRFYCLKFRLPFHADRAIWGQYERFANFMSEPMPCTQYTLPYFDGTCYLQKFARTASTELRMIGCRYPRIKHFDVRNVESTLAPFNAIHRSLTVFRPYSEPWFVAKTPVDLSLVPSKFDTLSEACIIRDAVIINDARAGEREVWRALRRFWMIFTNKFDHCG
jgi:hypothetical protein